MDEVVLRAAWRGSDTGNPQWPVGEMSAPENLMVPMLQPQMLGDGGAGDCGSRVDRSPLWPQVCDLLRSWSLCCDLCANSIFMLPVSGRRSPFSWEQ